MSERMPTVHLAAFSSPGAAATSWERGRAELASADVYWLSTVRPNGHPHVTPLLAVWAGGALYFCTGSTERKARNLAHNPHCILTTGRNDLDGIDLVVEGAASEVTAVAELGEVASAFESKYGPRITAPAGTWFGLGDAIRNAGVELYRVSPTTAFGFAKGATYSQTRWSFN
jgi:hypothetical protein